MTLTPTGISSSPVANAARASARAAGLVEVVEHEHAARGHAREELAEPAAREAVQVAPVLVGEEREPPGLLPAEAAAGEAEVVEERPRIGVARVDVVPDRVELPRLEVARHEHRLAAARRARQPDDRMLAPLVEQPEEALARTDAIDAGTREFGELGGRGHCGGARKPPILAVPGDLPCAVTSATTGGSRSSADAPTNGGAVEPRGRPLRAAGTRSWRRPAPCGTATRWDDPSGGEEAAKEDASANEMFDGKTKQPPSA